MQVRGSSRENEKMMDKTYALKETNLTILSRLVLPTHSNRGSDSSYCCIIKVQDHTRNRSSRHQILC